MTKMPKVLAVASGGGHWIQLCRLVPAWDGCAVTYVATDPAFRDEMRAIARERGNPEPGYHVIPDANRWQKMKLVRQFAMLCWIMLKVRPDTVITTGAAPGYFALRLGRLLGARTVWLDSIANAEELSLSGRQAGPYATLWLTQWPDVAEPDGPDFRGSVL
jgi:UDP-N-acetylglucosamine:LPS N-acetylglucosamine transferase